MNRIYPELRLYLTAVILLFLFVTAPAFGLKVETGEKGHPQYRVPTVTSKIKLDGVLDEAAWEQALKLELKFEVEPGKNIEPPVKTELYIANTKNNLYVAFRAYDPDPSKIRARLSDRDNIENDDHVGIILDTFNDTRKGFGFLANPLGIQADRFNFRWDESLYEWDAIWGSAGRIVKDGYIIEMMIPFSSLRFQKSDKDQVWGIDAIRYYPRVDSTMIGLYPRDRDNSCYFCQAYKLIGFKGAKPGNAIELDPTLTTHLTQERNPFPDGKLVKKDSKIDPGITGHWQITPNITLTAAVNPDFSHVEADAAQLDVNTPTSLYYTEKRPFFLEGNALFLATFYTVYTRVIKDPDWGINITGKEGKHGFNLFTVQDKNTYFLLPNKYYTDTTTLDQSNISTVFRYRYDLGSSFVGLFVTDREGSNYYNRVISTDSLFRLTKKDIIVYQFTATQTKYPEQISNEFEQPLGKFQGYSGVMSYRHRTEHYTLYGNYVFISKDYRTDLGFIDLTNMKYFNGGVSYTWRANPGHWFSSIRLYSDVLYTKDYEGNDLAQNVATGVTYRGPHQSLVNVSYTVGKDVYLDQEFDANYLSFYTQIRPNGNLFLSLNGGIGDRVDYSNVRQGSRLFLNPSIQYNAGLHLKMSLDHNYERLKVDSGRVYTANLTNIRMVYQFNSRTFLRVLMQYANYDYNAANFSFPIDPKFKHLFSQILFSYKLNPRTVLFLGYSDNHYGESYYPLKQSDRTFFMKIGYALVL